jgi:hypothetical protein
MDIAISKSSARAALSTMLKCIITFLFIFDITILGNSTLFSSRKVIFILLIFYYLVSKSKSKLIGEYRLYFSILFIVNVLIILWLINLSLVWTINANASPVFSRELYFIIYVIVGPILLSSLFQNLKEFCKVVIYVMTIQAAIVFGQFLFEEVRVFLNATVHSSGNISYLRRDRATGVGAEGANLSVLLASGLYYYSYYMLFKQKVNFRVITIYFFILCATFLAARTGFYLALINSIIVLIFLSFKHFGKNMIKIIPTFILFVFVIQTVIEKLGIGKRVEAINTWITSLMRNGVGESSFSALLSMEVPRLTNETIVGTGIYRGTTSMGTVIEHDSGYVQMYSSMGLIFSVIFYTSLLLFMILLIKKIKHKYLKLYFTSYLIAVYVMEYKEPFIYYYMAPSLLITAILLSHSDEYKFLTKESTIK